MSSYNYAFDNPATLTDPTGLAPNDIIFKGEGGNTLRINTARKEVTTFELDFKLKESGEISLPNFKEMSSNFALGIQYTVSNTAMVGTGSNQEAFIQAMAFGSTPGTSYFAGLETAAVGGTSTEANVGASQSLVIATKGSSNLKPKDLAGGFGLIGVSGEVDLGAGDVGSNIEVSQSAGGDVKTVEVGITGSVGPNLSKFPFNPGPSRKVSVGGGGTTFLGTLPLPLGIGPKLRSFRRPKGKI